MKKYLYSLLVFCLVIVTGCSSQVTSKELLQSTLKNSADMKTYAFDSGMTLQLSDVVATDAESQMVVSMLNGAKVTVVGQADMDNQYAEATIGIEIPGDMKISLEIPFIMDKEVFFVKVPSIPMLGIPEDIAGKFVKIDLAELEQMMLEETGEAEAALPPVDQELAVKLGGEVGNVLINDFAETEYIVQLKGDEIPADLSEAEHVMKMFVNDSNIDAFIKILAETTLPQIFDVLNKAEYLEMLGVTAEELNAMKEEITQPSADDLKELHEAVTINDASITLGISKDDFMTNQLFNVDLSIPEFGKVLLTGNQTISDINKELSNKMSLPAEGEFITIDELITAFMFGGMM